MTRRGRWTLWAGVLVALGAILGIARFTGSDRLARRQPTAPQLTDASPADLRPASERAEDDDPSQRETVANSVESPPIDNPLPEPGTSEVCGRTVDVDGRPVAGAEVSLRAGESWLRTTTSDGEGRFRVAGAPVNVWSHALDVTCPGFAPFGLELSRLPSGRVADCGDLVLSRGGILAGVVLDDLGRSVSEADVHWTPAVPGRRMYAKEGVLGGQSDADGHFRFDHVAPGAVRLCAVKRGYVPQWGTPIAVSSEMPRENVVVHTEAAVTLGGRVYDRDTGDGLRARVRFLATDERPREVESGLDGRYELDQLRRGGRYTFGVEHPTFSYSDLSIDTFGGGNLVEMDAATLTNGFDITMRARADGSPDPRFVRVVDAAQGHPIGEATVGVAMLPTPDGPRTLQVNEVIARTGVDGIAPLPGRRPVGDMLVVSARGYRPQRLPQDRHETREIVVALERGLAIRAHVVGDDGPVADASIEIAEQLTRYFVTGGAVGADDACYSIIGRTSTDERGTAEMSGLTSLAFRVRARSADGRGAEQVLQLRDEISLAEVELQLVPLAVIAGRLNGGSASAGRYSVVAVSSDRSAHRATMDAQGRFEIDALVPGDYVVAIVGCAEGTLARDADVRLDRERRPVGIPVSLAAGERRELVIPVPESTGAVGGSVRINGQAVAGRFVRLEWIDAGGVPSAQLQVSGELATVTDASGCFLFEGLQPGRWELRVSRDGDGVASWALAALECVVADGVVTPAHFDVDVGELVLRFVDADSREPMRWASSIELVSVADESKELSPPRRGRRIHSNGREFLRLPEVEPGRYRVTLTRGETWGQVFEVESRLRQEVVCEYQRKR